MRIENRGGVSFAPTAETKAPQHDLILTNRAPKRPDRNRTTLLLHRNEVASASLLGVLADRGLDPVTVRAGERGQPLPDPRSVGVAILVGSAPYGDVAEHEWHARELDWLREADRGGTSVLGIGHGARAIAVAFGGAVEAAPHPHLGWAMVSTLVPHQVATGPWLSWQHDVITLPPGAELLAHNRFGPQVFRIGRHLAVQFHPEATTDTVARWAAATDRELTARDLLAATARDGAAADVCARRLFSTFISRL
jgi:GMP synthase-like glutamine amidotransferase